MSTRLFNEIHGRLLKHGRDRERQPGAVRVSQNWIGGTRPGNARFVPPRALEVQACLADLEGYLSAKRTLVRIARAHA